MRLKVLNNEKPNQKVTKIKLVVVKDSFLHRRRTSYMASPYNTFLPKIKQLNQHHHSSGAVIIGATEPERPLLFKFE